MEKPSIAEVLLKQVKAEVVEKDMDKEVKGSSVVDTSDLEKEVVAQTYEANEEEIQPTSIVVNTVNTCIHLNSMSDNILNSSNSPIMTKSTTPTSPQSPKPLS